MAEDDDRDCVAEGVSMGIDVDRADMTASEWDGHVERAPGGTVFHRSSVLETLAEHAGAELHTFAGYKGQEVRALFPLFEIRKGPVSTLFSPPPRLGIPYLGPVLVNCEKLKRQKTDRTNRQFVESCLSTITTEIGPKYVHVEAPPAYRDVRPFGWNDFETTPRYTYELDLSGGADAVMERFRGNLRSDIRRHEGTDYRVFEGGRDAIEFTIERVRERFESQGESYAIEPEDVCDLYETLGDDRFRPYIGAYDGEWISGIVVLESDDRIYYWQGGGKPDADIPMNDLLHWRVITDAIERGIETYDLVGANTRRISKYKSKFNPELVPYYELERGTRSMNVVSSVYRRLG